jgi:hypothetical protein
VREQCHHSGSVRRSQLVERGVDGGFERGVVGERSIGQGLFLGELPDPFDEVQVRRVRGQVDQVDAGARGDAPHDGGVLVAGVVPDDADRPLGVGLAEFQQQAGDGNLIDGAVGGFADERAGDGIQGAQDAVALPASAGGDDPTHVAPEVAEEGTADEVGGIDEEDFPLARRGLFQEGLQGLIMELLLDDGVRLGRDPAGLAVAEAATFLKTAAPA